MLPFILILVIRSICADRGPEMVRRIGDPAPARLTPRWQRAPERSRAQTTRAGYYDQVADTYPEQIADLQAYDCHCCGQPDGPNRVGARNGRAKREDKREQDDRG